MEDDTTCAVCRNSGDHEWSMLIEEVECAAQNKLMDEEYWSKLAERASACSQRQGKFSKHKPIDIFSKLWFTSQKPVSFESNYSDESGEGTSPQLSREEHLRAEAEQAAVNREEDKDVWLRLGKRVEDLMSTEVIEIFMNACRGGDEVKVKQLLAFGVKVDIANQNGSTGLHFACAKGDLSMAQLLVSRGAELNVVNSTGLNCFLCACNSDTLSLCKWLCEEGADIHKTTTAGRGALHLACMRGSKDIASWLISLKFDPSKLTQDGTQCIHFSIHGGRVDIVEMLIEAGCAIDAKNNAGDTAFLWACELGSVEMIDFLLSKGANMSSTSKLCLNGHHYASIYDHVDTVRHLQLIGLPVDMLDRHGFTPLHHACSKGNFKVASYLAETTCLSKRTSVNATALHCACEGGNVEIVKLLLRLNLSHGEVDSANRNIFHCACSKGNIDALQYLLHVIENPLVYLESGCSPHKNNCMHLAVRHGHRSVVALLLKAGMDFNLENDLGKTAVVMASELGDEKTVKILVSQGAQLWN